jgi:haloacetate dehalogenase
MANKRVKTLTVLDISPTLKMYRSTNMQLGRGKSGLKYFSKEAMAEYVRAFKDPRTIHATCEDYRASATIDLMHDQKEKTKIRMPVLALWGRQGVIEALFDCLANWREVASDVRGRSLPCGHLIPEEKPKELLAELRRFLKGP